jgi:hypothetical protein
MTQRTTIVRKCGPFSKARLHDQLMVGWQRCVARYGKQPFAEALEITTVALDKQLQSSMPDFSLIVNARSFDEDVLNEILDDLGLRIVSKEAVCDTDDLNVLLARALVKINEAQHPSSPAGRAIAHSEYLDGEELMRALHTASGEWLQACANIRKPREVA